MIIIINKPVVELYIILGKSANMNPESTSEEAFGENLAGKVTDIFFRLLKKTM